MMRGADPFLSAGRSEDDFELLVRRAFDNSLTELEFDELQSALRESSSNRQFYLDYASVHALLIQHHDVGETSVGSEQSTAQRRALYAGLTLSTLALGVLISVVWLRPIEAPHRMATPAPQPAIAPPIPPPVTPVAQLLEIVEPSEKGSVVRTMNQPLLPNQLLRGEALLTRVRFASGADIVLEAGGELRLTDSLACELLAGVLVCDVPKAAHGFSVRSGTAQLIDRGTSFGVTATPAGDCAVTVFSGVVDAQLESGRGAPLNLTTATAAQLTPGESRWRSIEFDATRFERPLGYQRGVVDYSDQVRCLAAPPPRLRCGELESPDTVFLIREATGLKWPASLRVDQSTPALFALLESQSRSRTGEAVISAEEWLIEDDGARTIRVNLATEDQPAAVTLDAGQSLNSYLLHFDPPGAPVVPTYDSGQTSPLDREGSVTFHGRILGLIWRQETLLATDRACGLRDTQYETTSARHRTLSWGSELTVSPDQRTLHFKFLSRKQVAQPLLGIDEVRVLVDSRPAPSE